MYFVELIPDLSSMFAYIPILVRQLFEYLTAYHAIDKEVTVALSKWRVTSAQAGRTIISWRDLFPGRSHVAKFVSQT